MDKKIYIDKIVLGAKIGNKSEYEHLRLMYDFLLEQIYQSFASVYPFLKTRKMDMFHDYYFYFWEAINEYDFNGNCSFSYFLKNKLFENTRLFLKIQYGFSKIKPIKEIKRRIYKKRENKQRLIIQRVISSSFTNEKKIAYLVFYRGYTLQKTLDFYHTECKDVIADILNDLYKKIREGIKKESGKNKIKIKSIDKIYKIYQKKLENLTWIEQTNTTG